MTSYSGALVDDIAAILALLAAVSFALAATLWQKAALSLDGVSFRRPLTFLVLLTQWVWLLGLVAQIVGVVLQAGALDRGRVSIVQPLLVTTVIWALPLGYFLTQQAVGRREVLGAGIIVVGLALFARFGDPAEGVDNAPGSDWAASILVIGFACAALLLFANRGSLSTKAAVLGTIAGMLYGLSATLMKPVVEGLHTDGLFGVMGGWEFWVWAVAGIVGFLFQQLSLATGRLVPSVATVSVANPLVSVMLGALVLQETLDKDPAWHAVTAVGALGLALFGAVVISSARESGEADHEHPEAGGAVAGRPAPAA
jgi:drug/metabolite transporter (DMT)-like permease